MSDRCGCGKVDLGLVCRCVPVHSPTPFSRFDSSKCPAHRLTDAERKILDAATVTWSQP